MNGSQSGEPGSPRPRAWMPTATSTFGFARVHAREPRAGAARQAGRMVTPPSPQGSRAARSATRQQQRVLRAYASSPTHPHATALWPCHFTPNPDRSLTAPRPPGLSIQVPREGHEDDIFDPLPKAARRLPGTLLAFCCPANFAVRVQVDTPGVLRIEIMLHGPCQFLRQ